jgi:hypothetical protein
MPREAQWVRGAGSIVNISSKRNDVAGPLAACPTGGPQICRNCVVFLGKVVDLPCEIRLVVTNLRATECTLYTGHYTI